MKSKFIILVLFFLISFSNISSNQILVDNFNQSGIEDLYLGEKALQTQLTSDNIILSSDNSQSKKDDCNLIYSAMLDLPGAFVNKIEGSFYDDYLKKYIDGCLLLISGTWSELGENQDPINLIFNLLSDNGWSQYVEYSADGPDGTIFSLIKDDDWCIVKGQWNGGDDADSTYVPSDAYQIIVMCGRLSDN